jgi:DNA-binding NarL/FixJ family response regulator
VRVEPRTPDQLPKSSYRGLYGARLSPRERDVLALVAQGLGWREVAAALDTSESVVKRQKEILYAKLGAANGAHAVALGIQTGQL